ncbi:hypothetical protein T4B_15242 [Trichinella pseudospiralis]|uniref:Uncharacterized protein n=1 Tax=Trichinella pseudospiralis TaxID=6337 RepID=A0A0V1IL75_TRIPS|nr:hypothetical protein T4B_15242 [Trichinella pseudospiralis]
MFFANGFHHQNLCRSMINFEYVDSQVTYNVSFCLLSYDVPQISLMNELWNFSLNSRNIS